MVTSVQRRYPVRYWVTLAYFVGLPNFIHFDPTGRTHNYGLFNLTSLTDIVTTMMAAGMLVLLTALGREPLFVRKVRFDAGLWLLLLLSLTLATVLQPAPKLGVFKATDVIMSLYRLGQCLLGFLLIVSLYSRASEEEAPRLLTQMVARISWATLAMIFVMAPIVPSLAYVSEDATLGSVPRLGGIAIHPSMIALSGSIVFLHSFLFLRGSRRVAGCAIALVALTLSYTRSNQVVFVLACLVYVLFITRKRSLRWVGVASVMAALAGGVALHSTVDQYLARGQSQADVDSLGGRAATWEAGMEAFWQRPMLGYGFIAGPKNAMHDVWRETHWVPPHAHNDFIQALMSGGVLTGALTAWLYLYTFWMGCRRARMSLDATFFFLIYIQLLVTAVVSTNLMTGFGKPALYFVMSYLVLVVPSKEKVRARLAYMAPVRVPMRLKLKEADLV